MSGWWPDLSLPLPVLIGAGLMLAIASNRHRQVRIRRQQRDVARSHPNVTVVPPATPAPEAATVEATEWVETLTVDYCVVPLSPVPSPGSDDSNYSDASDQPDSDTTSQAHQPPSPEPDLPQFLRRPAKPLPKQAIARPISFTIQKPAP
ncbi:MAG: hypothetical protein ACFB8W_22085 [Elainellaceae cyanobacterium]